MLSILATSPSGKAKRSGPRVQEYSGHSGSMSIEAKSQASTCPLTSIYSSDRKWALRRAAGKSATFRPDWVEAAALRADHGLRPASNLL
jgi:hypothetical protein